MEFIGHHDLAPYLTQAHISFENPITTKPTYPKSSRKLTSHTHSRFRPYDLSRHHSPASSTPSFSASTPLTLRPHPNTSPVSSLSATTKCHVHCLIDSSPIPFPPKPNSSPSLSASNFLPTTNAAPTQDHNITVISSSSPYPILAILSRGKGKSKLILDEDDIPLTQLKKSNIWTTCSCQLFIGV